MNLPFMNKRKKQLALLIRELGTRDANYRYQYQKSRDATEEELDTWIEAHPALRTQADQLLTKLFGADTEVTLTPAPGEERVDA